MTNSFYDDIKRIADNLGELTKQNEKNIRSEERTIVSGVHNFYACELENILDNVPHEFDLRRNLRNLVRRAKEAGSQ